MPVCSSSPTLCSSLHPSFTFSLLICPSKGFPPSTYLSAAATAVSCCSLVLSPLFFLVFFSLFSLVTSLLSLPLSCLSAQPSLQHLLLLACRLFLLSPLSHHLSFSQASALCCCMFPPIHFSPRCYRLPSLHPICPMFP